MSYFRTNFLLSFNYWSFNTFAYPVRCLISKKCYNKNVAVVLKMENFFTSQKLCAMFHIFIKNNATTITKNLTYQSNHFYL